MILDWWRRLRGEAPADPASPTGPAADAPRPFVRRDLRHASLQFTAADAQSRMSVWRPNALLIGYTRTMMGFLRFHGDPRRILLVGLGGGSQAKYCHRHLPQCAIDVVEVNPHVIALRRQFRVPDDDARFRVIHADALDFVRDHRDAYDALLVDAYDPGGIPAPLSTQRWYHDCAAALRDGGVLTSNLYCDDAEKHMARLRHAFSGGVIDIGEPGMSNRVAFAWKGTPPGPGHGGSLSRAARRDLAAEFARVDAELAAQRRRQR